MNLKRAKALRSAINEWAQSKAGSSLFVGRAANDAYIRQPYNGRKDPKFWGGPIRVADISPRAIYIRAKRNDFNNRHPKELV